MSELVNEIDPRNGMVEVLKIHEADQLEDVSLCYGSIKLEGKPIFALYVLQAGSRMWILNATDQIKRGASLEELKLDIERFSHFVIKTDVLHFAEERSIPLSVAVQGKPAIAAYLTSVAGRDLDYISRELDVAGPSVIQRYLRRYWEDTEQLKLEL